MKALKVNLKDDKKRLEYSQKLQSFERSFTYPLGEKKFHIAHGLEHDYFSFFEQLGHVSYLVVEDKGKIVGAICAVLRKINGEKSWYLCDFKILPDYRGLKIYRILMTKFFLTHYIKCGRMFAINMGATEQNKLFSHVKKIFSFFQLNIEKMFLYQFSSESVKNIPSEFWENHVIVTNEGKKDIVINGQIMPIYHIVEKKSFNAVFNKINLFFITTGKLMFLSHQKIFMSEYIEISIFHHKTPNCHISSAEI